MNKSENYAHFSSTLKSLFSLSRKHETKNKHRERIVEEATNLWCTWMCEILTNLGGNGQHLPSNTPWERGGARPNEMVGLAKKECLVYTGQFSERRVEEATNLWCTWMGEFLTNFGENRQHLPSNTPWERGGARPNGLVGLGKKEGMVYTGQVSAGWWI